jgi:hypothetical protein
VLKSYVTSSCSVPLHGTLAASTKVSHVMKNLNGSQISKDAVEQRKQARVRTTYPFTKNYPGKINLFQYFPTFSCHVREQPRRAPWNNHSTYEV